MDNFAIFWICLASCIIMTSLIGGIIQCVKNGCCSYKDKYDEIKSQLDYERDLNKKLLENLSCKIEPYAPNFV
jgi:hypothetical protein